MSTYVRGDADKAIIGGLAGLTLGAAFFAGYTFANKKLQLKYKQLADDEISEMREHFQNAKPIVAKKPDLDDLVEGLGYREEEADATGIQGFTVEIPADVELEDDELINVFDEPQEHVDHWDYAEEIKTRRFDVPYVIHKDEFFENEGDYTQAELTYYEGDDVLADAKDDIIDDQDAYIGLANLAKFGHGSQDPVIVYVRNVELEIDFEITHSDGKYAHEVHGFPDELQHSEPRHHKGRQRFDDE
jgi:hypothetical protein